MEYTKDDSYRVKGIAVVLLIFHHMCYKPELFAEFGMKSICSTTLVVELAVLARVCVPIFVFVSSYGLAHIYTSTPNVTPVNFAYKRWVQLMSSYWFVYPFQIVLLYFNGDSLFKVFEGNYSSMLIDVLGLGEFFKTNMIAGINWYMFLAQLIVLGTPILCAVTKKYGMLSLIYMFLLMQFMEGHLGTSRGGDLVGYAFAIALGNYLAVNDVFNKIKLGNLSKIVFVFVFPFVFILSLYLKHKMSKTEFSFMWLHSVVLAVGVFALCAFISITLKKDILLRCLGKYSANMYFTHIFIIRSSWLYRITSDVFLLLLISVLICFFISLGIEFLKRVLRYPQFIKRIDNLIK